MQMTLRTNHPHDDPNELVSAAFEACDTFDGRHDGSPVCVDCGWLDHEHQQAGAEIRVLSARTVIRRVPSRLAS